MIDRDQLREALAFEDGAFTKLHPDDAVDLIYEAARLVADPDTLVLSKVDGEWPDALALGRAIFAAANKHSGGPLEPSRLFVADLSEALDALLEGPK